MRTLKELLPKKNHPRAEALDEKTVFHIAKRIIVEEYGVRGGENIIPVLYRDKKLFLSPRSSLWASEILLQRESLCKRINGTLGTEAVQEIKMSRQ
ncbi:MAG: hypothetical protein A3E38_01655 [Candidatus Moranbacteria bacterium RIFCSPHIGHO2_12_FULL_54_9]|nr:MAG: hypothetical protein A2878_00930 [Candidatus Moranbacteria bacterium RIFCSPHIGHO2_01_FULL_54_31]OGI25996.1 MAG: hypothetical protein A3E38_01655 [Candidatus Moranbacteria bacterium RIFCSPHIGHO2_12_FULL_54_9]